LKIVNSDIAYDYIRKRILSGEYPPGKPLVTDTLSAEIGISRTPVRDALRQLEADGLVSIRPHLGASVKTLTLQELREVCELRLALETHAAGLSARNRTAADLNEMKFTLQEMRALTDRVNAAKTEKPLIEELVKADIRFHIAVITGARNALIKKEILRLHVVHRIVGGCGDSAPPPPKPARDVRRRAVMASHEAIFDAIARQDIPAAKHEMELHIQDIIDHSHIFSPDGGRGYAARELTEDELTYLT
jgi:DNA-binding GntR family transcriptional regulator